MELSKVGMKFRGRYKLLDGTEFLGQILNPPDTSRVSNFLSARRYLRVTVDSLVTPRSVVVVDGVKYIVAEHGRGFHGKSIYQHFKLFEVDEEKAWTRPSLSVDTVTGLKKPGTPTSLGTVYMSTITSNDLEDGLKIQTPRGHRVCNALVQVDDFVGDMVVTKLDVMLGVSILDVKVR